LPQLHLLRARLRGWRFDWGAELGFDGERLLRRGLLVVDADVLELGVGEW
jgi:hypothetical protein